MSFNPYVPFQRQLAEVNFMAGGATFQAVLTLYQCLLGISILLILGSLWIRLTKARESVRTISRGSRSNDSPLTPDHAGLAGEDVARTRAAELHLRGARGFFHFHCS